MADALVADFERLHANGAVVRAAFVTDPAAPVTVLFGPSGAGKSTILRCLAGLDRPASGTVRLGGETWFDGAAGVDVPPQRRHLAYLRQDYALFPHLTVRENVAFGLADLAAPERARRTVEKLELLGIGGLAERRPGELSGGERQRVALARALAPAPRLALLDEPLSALDAPTREELRGSLRSLLAGLGLPSLVVTHDRSEALALGDRVVIVAGGRTRQQGAVAEVFSRPADLEVARIVGVETVVAGRIVDTTNGLATVEVAGVRIVAPDPGTAVRDVFVSIRAEDVVLGRGQAGPSSARNHWAGRIADLTPDGPLVRVTLDCGFRLSALVTRPACEELGLAPGAAANAAVKAAAVHLIPRG